MEETSELVRQEQNTLVTSVSSSALSCVSFGSPFLMLVVSFWSECLVRLGTLSCDISVSLPDVLLSSSTCGSLVIPSVSFWLAFVSL